MDSGLKAAERGFDRNKTHKNRAYAPSLNASKRHILLDIGKEEGRKISVGDIEN